MNSTELLRTEESWIQTTPGVCGGDACIRNTRIPVWSVVVVRCRLGKTDVDLCHHFVTPLTLADVRATLAYYEQHREEIDREIEENESA